MDDARLTSQVLAPSRLDAATVAAWERLHAATPGLESPFLSVHYARAVEAAGIRVRVCVLYRDGQPCGFLPYQLAGTAAALARAGQPVGGWMSDYVGLVAAPGLRITPACLLKLARLNSFDFSHLDQGQLDYGLSAEQPRIGLRLRLAPGAALEAQLRDQHRYLKDSERCARQLARDAGPLEFVFDERAGRAALLEQLVSHKRAQYARTGVPDALAPDWTVRLLHLLADGRHPTCSGQLSTLYAGGKWMATHFGLTANGVLHHWMPVYNPDYSRYAPGRLLMHQMIEACPGAGLNVIDHGEGDSPSKRQLSNEEHHYYRGAWHNRSLMSFATRSYQSLKWRLKE
jgi:CelD/BcsL family acetyltransferase involved in cellulose biosynthesis